MGGGLKRKDRYDGVFTWQQRESDSHSRDERCSEGQNVVWLASPQTGDVLLNLAAARTSACSVGTRDTKRLEGYNADNE